jgi:hypothetical protein
MITLIESNEESAKYQFDSGTVTKTVVFTKPENAEETPDFEQLANEEYEKWASWIGEQPQEKNPIELAEDHIGKYFSTPRLLQMKVWFDTLSRETTPKLSAVYNWTNNITIQASKGQTSFDAPPHLFEELLEEAISNMEPTNENE